MTMQRVKTHWEARWKDYDSYGSVGRTEVRVFEGVNAQAECKAFAMQQALDNGKTNEGDGYTRVCVYQVETHESKDASYSKDSVIEQLTTHVRPE